MAIKRGSKLSKLLASWPNKAIYTSVWLSRLGYSHVLIDQYRRSGWLKPIGRGAVARAGDEIDWLSGLNALQEQLKLPIHLGGKSALRRRGATHFLSLREENVTLIALPGTTTPGWFKKFDWGVNIKVSSPCLFENDLGIDHEEIESFSIRLSSRERAILEMLHFVPHSQSLEEAKLFMQGLNNLRGDLVQNLLESCHSIKVKRLFIRLATEFNFGWLEKLDLKRIDFGAGADSFLRGLSVPDITPHELLSAYHDGLRHAVDFAQHEVIPILSGQIGLNRREEAQLGLFYIIHSLASSGVRLNNKVDFVGMAGIARTLFELLVDLKILDLADLPEIELDRFHTFAEVDKFRKARRLVELYKKNPSIQEHSLFNPEVRKIFISKPGKTEEIEKKVDMLWGRTKKGTLNWPDHWSNLTIKDRVKKLGDAYEHKYLEIYALLSSYTHSGNTAYAGLSPNSFEYFYGFSLELTRKMYVEALLIIAKTFVLTSALESFSGITEFLQNAPKHILRDYGLEKMKETKTHSDQK